MTLGALERLQQIFLNCRRTHATLTLWSEVGAGWNRVLVQITQISLFYCLNKLTKWKKYDKNIDFYFIFTLQQTVANVHSFFIIQKCWCWYRIRKLRRRWPQMNEKREQRMWERTTRCEKKSTRGKKCLNFIQTHGNVRQQWIKRGSFAISTIWRASVKSNFKSINLWASPKNRVLTHSHNSEGSAAFIKIENTQTLCKSKNNSNSGFMLFLFSAWVLYINFSRPFSHRKPQAHHRVER